MLNPIGEARPVVRALVILAAAFAMVPAVDAQLVINEIMNNPGVTADGNGEWFEVFVNTSATVDLAGLELLGTSAAG